MDEGEKTTERKEDDSRKRKKHRKRENQDSDTEDKYYKRGRLEDEYHRTKRAKRHSDLHEYSEKTRVNDKRRRRERHDSD